jgi:hypothetical protein
LLHPKVERVNVAPDIAMGELAILEQDRTVNDEQQGEEADQTKEGQDGAAHDTTSDFGTRCVPGLVQSTIRSL